MLLIPSVRIGYIISALQIDTLSVCILHTVLPCTLHFFTHKGVISVVKVVNTIAGSEGQTRQNVESKVDVAI